MGTDRLHKLHLSNSTFYYLPAFVMSETQPSLPTRCYTDEFTTTIEGARAMLDRHGVAVIPGVMSDRECSEASLQLWGEFELHCHHMPRPLKRSDPTTWKECLTALLPKHDMLFQSGINHCQTAWDVRQHPTVDECFKAVHNTKEQMLVSFDGLSFLPAPEQSGYGFKGKKHDWYHVDQSFKRHGFECVQGFVTLQPVDEGDATLAVLSGSHLLHHEFLAEHHSWVPKDRKLMTEDEKEEDTKLNDDWYVLDRNGKKGEMNFFTSRKCRELYIKAPAGALVLWDSRTVHQGKNPDVGRRHQHERMVIYVCMMPKSKCPAKKLSRRIEVFRMRRGTTHWPFKVRMFPEVPSGRFKKRPTVFPLPAPNLTEHGLRLVGIDV
ncbi:MAG: hypothetical protein JSS82_12475 [Bacteroidetes bacterium]|nr:hypothetical protein [Bacteroidota bacterium]